MCILFHSFYIVNVNIFDKNKYNTKWKCKHCQKSILKCIEKGKLKSVYVGIYGDPNSNANKKIISRAKYLLKSAN